MRKPKTLKPELIAEFNKNASEVVRIQLTEYDGKQLLDIRVWVQNDKGEFIATRKGISLRIDLVHSLKEAILKAAKEIENAEGQVRNYRTPKKEVESEKKTLY